MSITIESGEFFSSQATHGVIAPTLTPEAEPLAPESMEQFNFGIQSFNEDAGKE